MYINDRSPRIIKRDTMSRWISLVSDEHFNKELKRQADKEKHEKRKRIIWQLIRLFEVTFADEIFVLETVRVLFEQWRKQDYRKDLPQARIQIRNVMLNNGLVDEFEKWEEVLDKKFK